MLRAVSAACRAKGLVCPQAVVSRAVMTSAAMQSDAPSRPERLEYGGKVRMGFIPDEWFQFFYKKTGVTGPYMFGVSFGTYLLSKEIWVMEHEHYNGVALAVLVTYAVSKMIGSKMGAYLDEEIKVVEDGWKAYKDDNVNHFKNAIEEEKKEQWRAEGQNLLFEAKHENVAMQLEAVYRERLLHVYNEVKRRLDYQVESQESQRRLEQRHMVNWVSENVRKSITSQQEKEALAQCISDLRSLASKA